MTLASTDRILEIFDEEFPKDTIRPGELFLTLKAFHALLQAYNYSYSKGTIYRWLNVRKEFLPAPVRDILEPAPTVWFTPAPPHAKHIRNAQIIPFRYLAAFTHEKAKLLASSYAANPDLLISLHQLHTHLGIMQQQVTHLIEQYPNLERKDVHHE